MQIPSCLPNMKVNMESVAQNPCKKDDQKNEEEVGKWKIVYIIQKIAEDYLGMSVNECLILLL